MHAGNKQTGGEQVKCFLSSVPRTWLKEISLLWPFTYYRDLLNLFIKFKSLQIIVSLNSVLCKVFYPQHKLLIYEFFYLSQAMKASAWVGLKMILSMEDGIMTTSHNSYLQFSESEPAAGG